MKVLIACEFSGIVRDAFIKKGHTAISCDLLPTEIPGPHYQGDVREIIRSRAFRPVKSRAFSKTRRSFWREAR